MCSQNKLYSSEIVYDNAVDYNALDYSENINCHIESRIHNCHNTLLISTDVTYRGIQYKNNMHVCTSKTEFGEYNLCQIRIIVITDNHEKIYFIGKQLSILYNNRIGLYMENLKENPENKYIISCIEDLLNPEPLLVTTMENEHLLSFKSAPVM